MMDNSLKTTFHELSCNKLTFVCVYPKPKKTHEENFDTNCHLQPAFHVILEPKRAKPQI